MQIIKRDGRKEGFDISKIGIIISDANGIMRYANSTFEKMFSVVERDYLNKPAGELFITAPQGAYQVLKTASKVLFLSTSTFI